MLKLKAHEWPTTKMIRAYFEEGLGTGRDGIFYRFSVGDKMDGVPNVARRITNEEDREYMTQKLEAFGESIERPNAFLSWRHFFET